MFLHVSQSIFSQPLSFSLIPLQIIRPVCVSTFRMPPTNRWHHRALLTPWLAVGGLLVLAPSQCPLAWKFSTLRTTVTKAKWSPVMAETFYCLLKRVIFHPKTHETPYIHMNKNFKLIIYTFNSAFSTKCITLLTIDNDM